MCVNASYLFTNKHINMYLFLYISLGREIDHLKSVTQLNTYFSVYSSVALELVQSLYNAFKIVIKVKENTLQNHNKTMQKGGRVSETSVGSETGKGEISDEERQGWRKGLSEPNETLGLQKEGEQEPFWD